MNQLLINLVMELLTSEELILVKLMKTDDGLKWRIKMKREGKFGHLQAHYNSSVYFPERKWTSNQNGSVNES